MSASVSSRMIESTKTYFREVDSGRLPDELFTADFEFFFPKFGVGRGLDEFHELAAGLRAARYKATHHRDRLKYIAFGQQLIVEGTTFGSDSHGGTWNGGETPGGRFRSVFDFDEHGLIERMYIYLDPDYMSLHKDRFHWRRAQPHW